MGERLTQTQMRQAWLAYQTTKQAREDAGLKRLSRKAAVDWLRSIYHNESDPTVFEAAVADFDAGREVLREWRFETGHRGMVRPETGPNQIAVDGQADGHRFWLLVTFRPKGVKS